MGEVVLVVEVVVAVVVAVVGGLSFLRFRTFLLVEVVAGVVVVVLDFGVVVVVVVEVEVESHGLGAGRWTRFHQGLREVGLAGSGLAVVLMTMLEGVAVVVWVAEDLSVVEVRLFHHLRLRNSVLT